MTDVTKIKVVRGLVWRGDARVEAMHALHDPVPCPFCGNADDFVFHIDGPERELRIGCARCGALGPDVRISARETLEPRRESIDRAADAWNSRS